jgi:hypothetical protein
MNEERLEALRAKYGKVGSVEFAGHVLVFRKPSRDHAREYRRKMDNAAEKPDALDQLAQATIVAFDDQEDPNAARVTFTTVFLEEFPLAVSNPKFNTCLSILAGLTEVEDAEDLGKGVIVRSAPRAPSPKA